MHQMILQLKDALKNMFSKGSLCWHKEAAVPCIASMLNSRLKANMQTQPLMGLTEEFTSCCNQEPPAAKPTRAKSPSPCPCCSLGPAGPGAPTTSRNILQCSATLLRDPEPEPFVWCAGSCTRHRYSSTPHTWGFSFALGRCAQVKPHWSQVLDVWGTERRNLKERMSNKDASVQGWLQRSPVQVKVQTHQITGTITGVSAESPTDFAVWIIFCYLVIFARFSFSFRVTRKKQLCIYGHGYVFISWDKITEIKSETLEK